MTPPALQTEPGSDITSVTDWLAAIDWVDVVISLVAALVVLFVAFLLSRVARRLVRRWVSNATVRGITRVGTPGAKARSQLRAQTLGDVMADVVTVLIWVLAVFTALGQIGVELGPLVAGAGIAGIALGFGAQNLVKDFFSGFFILLEDQFGIGDVIQIDPEVSGVVEDVTLRVTRLRSLDGSVWFVPNGEIRYLANKSKEWARALVDIQVAYGEDLDAVTEIIRAVAGRLREDEEIGPKILEDIEIMGVEVLGESGVTIRCYLKTQPLEQWTVARRFRQEIKRTFDAEGIEIPFPHRKMIIEGGFPEGSGAPAERATREDG